MPHWDRLVLLERVDAARDSLQDTTISDAQRSRLHALVERFSVKTKSIHASYRDVLAVEAEMSEILGAAGASNVRAS